MSVSFYVNKQHGLVEIELKGTADFSTVTGLMQKLIGHEDYQSHFSILVNFSDVTYVPSFKEIRQFGSLYQSVSGAFRGKVAFVVRDVTQLRAGQFASIIARTLHFQMNVFQERNNALAWITNTQENLMDSLQKKIFDVISPFQLASLATIQPDGSPWVRYVTTRADDKMTIRFATPLHSRKVSHIEANPNVHITCGCNDLTTASVWVQIAGNASIKIDEASKKAFWNDFLNAYFTGPNDKEYAVVEVTPSKIEYFTMASLQPEVLFV
ncbi:MAG: pyridoxamine 5'-phosphate oxidase family protein [Deltaproteobacteria bacterium]|nr:pyridoxamine 5'-phosphate oxidase family protein [Deltaproteobacteria bacterium]MBN2674836.1 pyridoxamine 5'-phosphate oxidase family protein [Deltaproteobacteria bacterium]